MTIKTKIFEYGNKCEAEWPSKYGTLDTTPMYVDPDTKEVKEGYPPKRKVNGTSAMVIFDSMEEQYHEGACRKISSRREWELADKETGSITFSSKEAATPRIDQANKLKQERAERRAASKKALDIVRANPKEARQKLEKEGEQQIKELRKAGLTKQLKDTGVRYE